MLNIYLQLCTLIIVIYTRGLNSECNGDFGWGQLSIKHEHKKHNSDSLNIFKLILISLSFLSHHRHKQLPLIFRLFLQAILFLSKLQKCHSLDLQKQCNVCITKVVQSTVTKTRTFQKHHNKQSYSFNSPAIKYLNTPLIVSDAEIPRKKMFSICWSFIHSLKIIQIECVELSRFGVN